MTRQIIQFVGSYKKEKHEELQNYYKMAQNLNQYSFNAWLFRAKKYFSGEALKSNIRKVHPLWLKKSIYALAVSQIRADLTNFTFATLSLQ